MTGSFLNIINININIYIYIKQKPYYIQGAIAQQNNVQMGAVTLSICITGLQMKNHHEEEENNKVS